MHAGIVKAETWFNVLGAVNADQCHRGWDFDSQVYLITEKLLAQEGEVKVLDYDLNLLWQQKCAVTSILDGLARANVVPPDAAGILVVYEAFAYPKDEEPKSQEQAEWMRENMPPFRHPRRVRTRMIELFFRAGNDYTLMHRQGEEEPFCAANPVHMSPVGPAVRRLLAGNMN